MLQHNFYSKGNAIYSSVKVEHLKNFVDDKSIEVSGKKYILSSDDNLIPITTKDEITHTTLYPIH